MTLVLKLAILAILLLSFHFFPFDFQAFEGNFHYPADGVLDWTAPFKTWDAQHYLFLADQGYAPGSESDSFYPLLPFLIHWTQFLFLNNALAAGLCLSHLFTFLFIAYFYFLVKKIHDEKTAFYSCLFLLTFPTGFYLGLVYTESLFLSLAAANFYYSREGKTGPAAFCAFLLPLSRPMGIMVLVPALMDLWITRDFKDPAFRKKLLLPPAFILGLAVHLTIMKITTRDFFAFSNMMVNYRADYSLTHLLHPLDWFIANFISVDYSWTGIETETLNRVFFLGAMAALIWAWRTLDRGLFVYALVLGLVPALLGNLMSYMRYAVVLFPLFIFAAVKLKDRAGYYLCVCLPFQGLLALAHALNHWVA